MIKGIKLFISTNPQGNTSQQKCYLIPLRMVVNQNTNIVSVGKGYEKY